MHLLSRPARRILSDCAAQIMQRLAHGGSCLGPEAGILIRLGPEFLDLLPKLIALGLKLVETGAGRCQSLVTGSFQPCQRRAKSLHRFIEPAHPSPHSQALALSCLSALAPFCPDCLRQF